MELLRSNVVAVAVDCCYQSEVDSPRAGAVGVLGLCKRPHHPFRELQLLFARWLKESEGLAFLTHRAPNEWRVAW